MADSSAAMTRSWVVFSGGTIPFPTVEATAVPVSAPTTLRTPAISTAVPGASTRVATEVAMGLAVSWKPLMKSKTRAMATMRTSMRSAELGILHYDPFQRVGNVLSIVGGILEALVNLSPMNRLDEAADITDTIEQFHECPVEYIIGLSLEPINLYQALTQVVPLPPVLQVWYRVDNEGRLFADDAGQEAGVFGWLVDVVEPDSLDRLLDGINKVVDSAGQVGDILAIKRSNEGAVERVEDLVDDLVAPVFEVTHPPGLAFDLDVMV